MRSRFRSRRAKITITSLACMAINACPLVVAPAASASVTAPAAVSSGPTSPGGSDSLEKAAKRAGDTGRKVAMYLIGLAFAFAAVLLVFKRDFREAAAIFGVGILAVLLATPSGLETLRSTVDTLFRCSAMDGTRRSEVRSFRDVFALERRIYRIDRLRLNPTGVPVRGVAYAAVLLVAMQLADGLPVLGGLIGLAPWPLRDLVAPLALAAVLTVLRIDGRPAHDALAALARFAAGPRHVSRFERCQPSGVIWRPGPLVVIPDGSQGRLRALVYRGPGRVR